MSQQPIGPLIDKMLTIKDQKSELAKQIKTLTTEYEDLEKQLMLRLYDEGTTQSRSRSATATISEIVIPTIDDWGAFEAYVVENEALYLLEKRPAGAAFRELIQQGESIPGLKPFTKQSISLRRL